MIAAHEFVDRWARAWNAHDLEAVLAQFTDDAEFSSPVAAQLLPGSDGVVRGKEALRAYWAEGLRRIPDLHFEVLGHYEGVGILVINYRNQIGRLVNEVLLLDADGLATRGYGTYLGEAENPAGAR
ncbi:nuclear transport factor 2 family protein [Catenulispora yoronensis]